MAQVQQKIHMDIASTRTDLPVATLLVRGAMFFGWLVAFLISMAAIGLIPTVPLFVVAFMRLEAREPWRIVLPYALVMCRVHLLSVRPAAGDPVAAVASRRLFPGLERRDPERMSSLVNGGAGPGKPPDL